MAERKYAGSHVCLARHYYMFRIDHCLQTQKPLRHHRAHAVSIFFSERASGTPVPSAARRAVEILEKYGFSGVRPSDVITWALEQERRQPSTTI